MFASSSRLHNIIARCSAALVALTLTASPALALEDAAGGPVNLLEVKSGLMFWTLLIFVILLFVLSKFAFKPLFAAVEAREKALEDAVAGAKRDRAEAQELLAKQQAQLEAARADAQTIIADSRAVADKMRGDMLAQAKHQQEEMIEQARRVIEGEKASAIAELRRESIDLAIVGASKVIGANVDSAGNRQIVESFLSSLSSSKGSH
jgi:F-type H+-transporting ATPase subunit b